MVSVPNELAPFPDQAYDPQKQLWINTTTGVPLVCGPSISNIDSSSFGETVRTSTKEGTDQPESSLMSNFGETVITKTHEGTDQSEISMNTNFGETVITETKEGIDASESASLEEFATDGVSTFCGTNFGESSHTATREGVDQSETVERSA